MKSRKKKCNQMRTLSPPSLNKSLTVLPQMIPPPSPTTIIFPPSLRTLLMMPGNTTSNIASGKILTVMTSTATCTVARKRIGIPTVPPPDPQLAEPMGTEVWTVL